jgi:hypothetical protein
MYGRSQRDAAQKLVLSNIKRFAEHIFRIVHICIHMLLETMKLITITLDRRACVLNSVFLFDLRSDTRPEIGVIYHCFVNSSVIMRIRSGSPLN